MAKKLFSCLACSILILWGIGFFHFVITTGEWIDHRHSIYEEIFLNSVMHVIQGCYDIFYYTIGWLVF